MKRGRKFSVCLAVVSLVVALTVPVQAALANSAGNSESIPISRLAGTDRYETAVKISQAGWADHSSQYAVLSAGMDNNLVDSLTAAPLAKMKNAPILLTQGDKLNDGTKAELQRLGVTTVYVTSGIGVITQPVLDELKAMQITVISLGGADRFATALNIAHVVGMQGKLVVASAYSNADALSIASIAASQGMPILLSNPDKLPDNVAAYLDSVQSSVQQTYVIGGTGVINTTVENLLPHPVRLGGADRFDTNMIVLGTLGLTLQGDTVYVANGEDNHLVDALTGSILAAKNSTAIVLTSNPMQEKTKQLLEGMFPLNEVVALGGDSLVSQTDLEGVLSYTNFTDNGGTIGPADTANPLELTGNIQITGNNTTLQNADISNNLYVTGENVNLNNLKVTGVVVLEPSGGGTITLNNVTARGIVMSNDAAGTFRLNDVTADALLAVNKDPIKVAIGGNTKITNTLITSETTLDGGDGTGTFGNLVIMGIPQPDGSTPDLSVQLAGTFQEPVMVASQAAVTAMSGATVNKIGVVTKNINDKVILQGTINSVDVYRVGNMEIADGSAINRITIYANTSITMDKTATVGGITKVNNAVLTLSGDGAQNVGSSN